MIARAGEIYVRFLVRWVDAARRAALPIVAAAVALTAALFYYTVNNLGINTDTTVLLSQDLPFRQQYLAYKDAFPQFTTLVIVVVDGQNPDLAEDAAHALFARLADNQVHFESLFYPAGDPFFARNGLLYMDTADLADLSERLADAQPFLATLTEDPSLRGLFEVLDLAFEEVLEGDAEASRLERVLHATADAVAAQLEARPYRLSWRELMQGRDAEPEDRHHFIVVQTRLDFAALQPAGAAIDAIRSTIRELGFDSSADVRVRLTGSEAISHEELESVKTGAGIAGIISLCLVSVLLVVGLGSFRLVVATLLTLIAGLTWTVAFSALAIGHLNLISVAFAVLFIGLAVDFGIHFCLRYREAVHKGAEHADALRATAQDMGSALSLCALAAAAGLYAFVPTDYVGLSELGIISGTGMFIALFANLTLLPALLTCMPLRAGVSQPGFRPAVAAERFLRRRCRPVVLGAGLVGLVALVVALDVRFDFNPMNLRDPNTESVATYNDLARELGDSLYTIKVVTPDLATAVELARSVDKLDVVDKTVTLADLVPDDQDAKLDIIDIMNLFLAPILYAPEQLAPPDADGRRTAAMEFFDRLGAFARDGPAGAARESARRLNSQLEQLLAGSGDGNETLIALENRLVSTLAARLERLQDAMSPEPVTIEDLPADLRARYLAPDGQARIEVYPSEDMSDNAALRRFVTEVRRIAPGATGSSVLVLETGNAIVRAMGQATLVALIVIAALLILILRRLGDAVLVLAPLVLAATLTVAASALIGPPFNFANVIVLPLLIGLGVASAIHLVMRARSRTDDGTLLGSSTARAVVFSALTTIASFGSLAVSSHRGMASMGELLMIALIFTLCSSLVVLPALMAWIRKRQPAVMR